MAKPHVMCALREKRVELAGEVSSREQQIVHHRVSQTHPDLATRFYDPGLVQEAINSRSRLPRSA